MWPDVASIAPEFGGVAQPRLIESKHSEVDSGTRLGVCTADSCDDALAGTINGLHKAGPSPQRGP